MLLLPTVRGNNSSSEAADPQGPTMFGSVKLNNAGHLTQTSLKKLAVIVTRPVVARLKGSSNTSTA